MSEDLEEVSKDKKTAPTKEADDAVEEEPDGEGEDGSSGLDKKKKIIIIAAAAVLVLLLGGGGAAYFLGFFGPDATEAEAEKAPPPAVITYYEFPPIMVDLKPTGRRTRYIKLTVVAELKEEDVAFIQETEVKMTDAFQSWLRAHTRKQLTGSKGTILMRGDFEDIVNNIIQPAKIEGILFKQVLIQ